MRNVKSLVFLLPKRLIIFMFIVCNQITAQTNLLGPTGDGGFENGTTLVANGWTGVSSIQTWHVGTSTVTPPSGGTNLAYTSTTSGSWTPGTLASVAHIYRDITIPAGEVNLTVVVKYKILAVDATFDYLKVHIVPTTTTPVAGTQLTTGQLGSNTDGTTSYNTYTFTGSVSPGTQRLVISFRQDGASPYGAAAIDEVSVTSSAPAPICNSQGTFTIDNTLPNNAGITGGNFSSFTNAINYINIEGICGPLTLNVAAGQTFTENPPALTATGTMANPIIFQKSGSGANPVLVDIQGTSSSTDFGFCISGGDYITFDGIDVNSSTATTSTLNLEFGYLLRNSSATNGAQNNTIKNCTVILNKNFVGSSNSGCIYSSVSTSQGGFVPTNATGANSNNKYYNLTLSNAQNGVYLVGNSSFPDLNNEIGVAGSGCQSARNMISNLGGIVTFTSSYGIRTDGQSGIKIFNNDISNVRSNQSSTAGVLLITFLGTNDIYNNKVSDISNSGSTSSTSRAVGIEIQNSTGTPTARVFNNIIYDIKSPYTSTATASRYAMGIFCNNTTSATVAEIDNNSVYLSVASGTPTYSSSCFEMASSAAVHKVRGNIFVNAFPAQGATAKHFCWVSTSSTSIGAAGSISNYNDLFILNDQATSGHIGRGSTTNYNTLTNWQAMSALPDANSQTVNPGFVSGTDLHASAPTLNAVSGFTTQSWVTTDLECADRSTASPSDFGAYVINTCSVADGGSITPSSQIKCAGQTATMTSTGATSGAGISYQWKVSSTSGSGYVNVTGGTGATTTSYTSDALSAGTYYYVLETTCSAGPTTDLSNELTVVVNASPTVTVSPASASLCTGGTPITLTAAGANTYAWTPSTGLSATTGDVVTANPTSTITYTVTGTDGNSCTNTATAVITVSTTPVAPTTTGYGICLSGTIPGGQGLTSTSVGGGVITGSQTINFDVASQPTETNSAPGNIVASATMNAMPAGSTITSVVITYSGLTALSSSWRSDIKLGLSGALINSAASDPLAPGTAGILNYSRTASSGITSTISGGTVNLLYWDAGSDNAGAEATFPTGTSVASVVVNYSYPSATAISWYDAASGGNFIGNGSPFNPIGLDPALPNSNVAGSYTYYAQVNNGTCSSTRTSAILTIGSTPTTTATSPQSTICIGSSVTLSANPMGASPFTYLWNDPSAATTQTVSVSPTSNTTYTVTVTDVCSATTTANITINVDAPSVGSPAATSVCGSGTSTLSTTGSTGTIKWYDAATNGNLVGTGTPVVSPTITSATTYYVEASNLSTPLTGLGSLGTPTPSNSLLSVERGIVITVTSSGTLNTAQFYSALGTYVGTARLVNNTSGTQLASTPISGTASSAGLQTMNLNWNLTAGTTYRLLLTLTTGTYSNNNTSVNYSSAPWNNFGSAGTITSGYDSGVSSTTYSNFYNMQFTPVCATSRTAVVVPYMVPPTSGTATATPAAICAGSTSTLNLSGFDPSYSSFTWSGGAGTGATVSVMPLATTSYTVTATDGTCSTSTSVTVTVNPLPTGVTATSNSPICQGADLNLMGSATLISGVSNYTFATSTGTYIPVSSPTTVHATTWDDAINNVVIPFTFNFNNVGYTSISVNSNGYITFGSTTSTTTGYTPISASTTYSGAVSAFGRDLISNSSTVVSGVEGSAPNRVLVIQWNNAARYSGSIVSGDVLNFQIRLAESTNEIQIVYGTCTATSTTSLTSQVGLRGGSNTDYNNRTSTTSWSSTSNGLSNSATMTSLNTIMPSSGQTYTFTPPATYTYAWSGPNGFTSSMQNPSITAITTAGAGTYTVSVTDPSTMCSATASTTVEIGGTTVTSTADAGPGTLRAALACVVDGGTIMYDQPTTATTILTAPLTIDKNVTIMGLDAANRPEITTSSSGISIDALKTLTLKDVDVKSTAPTQTFTGAGSVSISGLTVGKQ
jgi:hypothetical protein